MTNPYRTTYLLPMVRNLNTGKTLKSQELSGQRFEPEQRRLCQLTADSYAERISRRTGDDWIGFVKEYRPTHSSKV